MNSVQALAVLAASGCGVSQTDMQSYVSQQLAAQAHVHYAHVGPLVGTGQAQVARVDLPEALSHYAVSLQVVNGCAPSLQSGRDSTGFGLIFPATAGGVTCALNEVDVIVVGAP